jgi:thiamine transport system substrate-binding protein
MRAFVLWVVTLSVVACTRSPSNDSPKTFVVLTYSSMTGKNSLGELLKSSYETLCTEAGLGSCELVFRSEEGESSLVSTYLNRPTTFHAVLGLETLQLAQLQSRSPLGRTQVFARSPHAFIVDTHQWKDPAKWPTTWGELSTVPSSLFVQDPRVSAVGIGWLKAIFALELIDLTTARSLTRKVFPSWSLSYSAFTKGGAPLVWSYQSSEAYHRCEEKSDRFRVLPLLEGYPVQEEYLALAPHAPEREAKLFLELLVSDHIQREIPLKNWMWPVVSETPLPDCFKHVSSVRALQDPRPKEHSEALRDWMDRWSL